MLWVSVSEVYKLVLGLVKDSAYASVVSEAICFCVGF